MPFSLVRWLQESRWSIRTKLMTGFSTIALFIALLAGLSWLVINDLGQKINQVANTQVEVNQATQLADAVKDAKISLENIKVAMVFVSARSADVQANLTTPQEAYERYQPYLLDYVRQRLILDDSRTELNGLKQMINTSSMTPDSTNRFFQLMEQPLQTLLARTDLIRDAARNRQLASARQQWQTAEPELVNLMSQIDHFNDDLSRQVIQAQTASRKAVDDANNARNLFQSVILTAGIVAVLLALIFGLTLTLVFTRPVETVRRRLMQLAEGDLATPLEVSNRDQFGQLAITFNQSLNRLGTVVEQVQNQSSRVSSAAAEIATASTRSALVSVEQAGAVAEATVTIEQLSHTAQQIAEAATLVANAAELALGSASDGQETVRESILGINNLKNRVRNITDRILALSERSQRVGHIIDQVASIANQTHLLALNAAIESAAAGENGKRFAVVAASVKQLAERSRQATKDVQAVLGEIQAATNASVMATEQGMKEAERGVMLAHRTGDANENIIQMVERTVQLASAISLATQQQRSASEQVVSSMRQLATVIQDGASSAKQSSSLAGSLDEIALELRRLSNQFKVKSEELPPGDSSGASKTGDSLEEGTIKQDASEAALTGPGLRPEPAN